MSLVSKEINRRRHIRWQIKKHALLYVSDSKPISCTIQDFCSGGLFLGFNQSGRSDVLQQNQQVKVFFSVREKETKEDFQFDVEIMRICPNGIGVAFKHIPMSVFQALVKEANLQSEPISLGSLTHSPAKIKKKKFEKSFKELLSEHLPLILKEFFMRVDKELLKTSTQTENDTQKTVYFNAFMALKRSRKLILSQFCNSLLKEIRYIDSSLYKQKANSSTRGYGDSVTDQNEMTDWTDLASIVYKLESDYESQLNILEQKLSQVTGIPANQINNPLIPAKLFYSFRAAIENPEANNEIRKVIYTIFEEVLVSQLDQLYMQFDGLLMDLGAVAQKEQHMSNEYFLDMA